MLAARVESPQSPRDAPCHQLVLVTVERRQDLQRLKRRRGVDLGVRLKHAVAVIESYALDPSSIFTFFRKCGHVIDLDSFLLQYKK